MLAAATLAGNAAAQPPASRTDLLISPAPNPPGWWSLPGRPGWDPDRDLGAGAPWTLAGLARGAWTLTLPGRAREGQPQPGILGARPPILWSDSLVVIHDAAGWRGLDGSLKTAVVAPEPGADSTARRRPFADVVLLNGASGLSDNALALARGDSTGNLRLEAASGARGTSGSFAGAGRDLYGSAGTLVRGRHRFAGSFDHRRLNAELTGGEYERARGESGHAGWTWADSLWRIGATVVRGYDRQRSGGGPWGETTRNADATFGSVEIGRPVAGVRWGLRGTWREAGVRPVADSTRTRSRESWLALRAERTWRAGTIEAALGVGHVDQPRATPVAPSLALRWAGGSWRVTARLDRVLTPVWSDLVPNGVPFLQDAWVAGLDLDRRRARGASVAVSLFAGRVSNRALITRVPITAIALRSGWTTERSPEYFVLVTGDAAWRRSGWALGVEGHATARQAPPAIVILGGGPVPGVPRVSEHVDPGQGGLAFAEGSVRMFGGDLLLRPRVAAASIGPRTSELGTRLPGFVSWNALLQVTLADATMLIEGRNLTDEARPLVWMDGATGVEAVGPGREIRFTFSWRLWN